MEKEAVSKSGVKNKFTSFFFLDKLIKITVFLTKLFHAGNKMLMQKLYNRFHIGKNGIRVSKNCIFSNIQLKGVVNRLPPFKN